jgi:SAM-dependent methyltransferase
MRPDGPWRHICDTCQFQAADLSPAEGHGFPSVEDLRRENFVVILDHLEKLKPLKDARILEVGSAWGWFLEAAQARQANVRGIEPGEASAEALRAKGLAVETGLFPADLQDRGPYDVIVFNDVFEHLPVPSQAIKDVEALLAPNGLVVLNYPSSDGILFKIAALADRLGVSELLDRMWQKNFPSPHVSYFNPDNMDRLVLRHTTMTPVDGFTLKSVSRRDLWARLALSNSGVKLAVLYLGVWVFSFLLAYLPADIFVTIYRKPQVYPPQG